MQGGRALRHRLGLCHGQQHAAFPAGRGGCVVAALFLRGAIWGHWDILLGAPLGYGGRPLGLVEELGAPAEFFKSQLKVFQRLHSYSGS